MLNIDDTIAAVSSAAVPVGAVGRSIIRISGPQAYPVLSNILASHDPFEKNRISHCVVKVDADLNVPGRVYAFFGPHSYTGQDLAELHLDTCGPVTEKILENIYQHVRPAQPGEFTQRAYLNGKLDLTQAEAVAEIVSAANVTQLQAAERLLSGNFSQTLSQIRNGILELLSHLEAELDFSEEPIEFISKDAAFDQITSMRASLQKLLDTSIRCERLIDLDAVGLAGLPNAGKSSLLNALLGQTRSIVSDTEATTRDVLAGTLRLEHLDCVLFDCAGLLGEHRRTTIIDQLSHEASLTALNKSAVVLFCVDAGKTDFDEDVSMLRHITAEPVIFVMTKSDTLSNDQFSRKQDQIQDIFKAKFLPVSIVDSRGLKSLKTEIQTQLMALRRSNRDGEDRLTINQRHAQKLKEAVKLLAESADEIRAGAAEIAAMLLRQACDLLGGLQHEDISESILERIFSQFCIGK